jgi:hypothetical protein
MMDPFWLGVLITLAVEGGIFAFLIAVFLAYLVVAIAWT